MNDLTKLIIQHTVAGKIDKGAAAEIIKKILAAPDDAKTDQSIAIIGMALRLPAAKNTDEFWENLRNGLDCIQEYPKQRQTDSKDLMLFFTDLAEAELKYCRGGYLEDIDQFDYDFFRLTPKEASLMDPTQRIFLETVWETLEDAGYTGKKLAGSRTGVYLGNNGSPLYWQYILKKDPSLAPISVAGNVSSMMAGRISYILDLRGPSMIIDTACSSSLAAVHLACQGIRNGECEQAIAGGVKLNLLPAKGVLDIGISSANDQTRAFDESSDGTVWGEGSAAILLKPLAKALADGDNIHAVIKGSAVNQDGTSVGISAPNPIAQEEVIVRAWEDAGIDPESISYIEAHGTGTKLGDPIEILGIQKAFQRYTAKKQFCGIGSVKTNLGHLDCASGITGLIKAVLALKHKQLPPSLHFNQPNRKISFEQSPVYLNDKLTKWETEGVPRRCGVSGFGFSGTNCHVILEEPPEIDVNTKTSYQIFTLSAKSEEVLKELIKRYQAFTNENLELNLYDICYTVNTGREHYDYRLAVIVKDVADLRVKIAALNPIELEKNNERYIHYGKHKIITEEKEVKENGEVTEAELREISEIATIRLKEYLKTEDGDEKALSELCSLYVKGARVEWEKFYNNGRIVSLPVHPFERKRCWFEVVKTEGTKILSSEDNLNYVGPRNDTEKIIVELCQEVLGIERVGIYDDFFELGGQSLLAIGFIAKLRQAFHKDISLEHFFDNANIAQLARFFDDALHEAEETGNEVEFEEGEL